MNERAREQDAVESLGDGRLVDDSAVELTEAEGSVNCYVLFRSHTDGLALFSALKDSGVGARIAPTPRAARATCGMSLLITCHDEARVQEIAEAHSIYLENIVHLAQQIRPDRDRYC